MEETSYELNEGMQFLKENTPETGFSRPTKRNRESVEIEEEWTVVNDEDSAITLKECSELLDMGWRIQKAMEVSQSYGVIRDVDLDLSDEEVFNNISCPEPAVLISSKRLSRRSPNNDGWTPCETVKLCFKGSALPPYVLIYDMRVKVEPYVFPVTQCSHCWKMGHSFKMCPTKKIVCPKCGNNHANCESTTFRKDDYGRKLPKSPSTSGKATKMKRRGSSDSLFDWNSELKPAEDIDGNQQSNRQQTKKHPEPNIHFSELLSRLKDVIFS
ncbi:hypothetical protein ACJJTC_004262 [Scirpophaga incertulas]